ncbi:MAG: preprotein translocase subunit SecE [Candidatus Eisenbacteria bacterium]|nr:preprotein translocase subunit SecE [Candidatus Eisenbacteria bacterium]
MSAFEKIRTFLNEVKVETKKINWPKPQELKESTTVVIVAVFVITVFITLVDLALNNLLNLFITV